MMVAVVVVVMMMTTICQPVSFIMRVLPHFSATTLQLNLRQTKLLFSVGQEFILNWQFGLRAFYHCAVYFLGDHLRFKSAKVSQQMNFHNYFQLFMVQIWRFGSDTLCEGNCMFFKMRNSLQFNQLCIFNFYVISSFVSL